MPLNYIPEKREMNGYLFDSDSTRQKKAAKRAKRLASVLIEGEYLTATDIGERLGVSSSVARERLQRCKKMPGPVTWERLRSFGK